MILRTFAAFFAASGLLLAAAPASAQVVETSDMMGLRLEANIARDFDVLGGGNSPQGDIRIGYDLPMGLTPIVGFGLRSKATEDFDRDDRSTGSEGETHMVLAVELRYYFSPHKRGLQPFGFGEFNTHIASFGSEEGETDGTRWSDARKEQEDLNDRAQGDRESFTNLNLGIGMEYKFDKSFALGAKWGVGLHFAGTSLHEGKEPEGGGRAPTAGENTSNTTFGTSAAFYAAFRI